MNLELQMDITNRVIAFNQKHPMARLLIEAQEENRWVVHLEGELELHSSTDAQSILEILIGEMPSRSTLVCNLEKLFYISSTGVGLFANLVVTANKRGITVILRTIQPKVEQVFSLLGILSYFTIEK